MTDTTTTSTNTDQATQATNQATQQQSQVEGQDFDIIEGERVPRDLSTVEDPDMRDRYQLLREERDAATAGEGGTGNQGTTPAAATTDTTAPAAGGTAKPQAIMVPKERLDQVLAQVDQLRTQNAFLQGKISATAPAQAGGEQGGTTQQQTQTDPLADARAELKALAKQYDNGEITMEDLEEKKATIQDRIDAIREERLLAKVPQQQPQAGGSDLVLDERTAEIENQHPYSKLVFPDQPPADPSERTIVNARIEMIKAEAIANLRAANPGMELSDSNPRALLLLREEQAKLADKYGPTWFPNAQVKVPAANGGANGGQQALSPKAQDRLNALQTASQQPVDTNAMGAAGNSGQIDDKAIMAMSEDDLLRLPEAQRERLLKGT